MLIHLPFILNSLKLLSNACWILSNASFGSVEMIVWFLSFAFLMWYIMLIDLQILNHNCIPGICFWYMILLMYCWLLFANNFLRIFYFYFCSSGILPVIFFSRGERMKVCFPLLSVQWSVRMIAFRNFFFKWQCLRGLRNAISTGLQSQMVKGHIWFCFLKIRVPDMYKRFPRGDTKAVEYRRGKAWGWHLPE